MAWFWEHSVEVLQATQNWLLVGVALLLGHGFGKLANRFRLPSVVGYLIVGVLLGRSVLGVISEEVAGNLDVISSFGLGIIAFMIGAELSPRILRRLGRKLVVIVLIQSSICFVTVALLVWLLSGRVLPALMGALPAALIFGALAPPSAPAGTVAVIQEYRSKGLLTSMLLGVVGLDDGLAVVIFTVALALAKLSFSPQGFHLKAMAVVPLELGGTVVLGILAGLALAWLAARTRTRAELLTLTFGIVLVTTGVAEALGLSLILANLVAGMTVAAVSKRQTDRTYGVIEQITHPIYVLFFLVAGAHLDLRVLLVMGWIAPVYILGRTFGKLIGAHIGGVLTKAEEVIRKYLGLGTLSEAGVAIGLAIIVHRDFTALGPDGNYVFGEGGRLLGILAINTIAATTIFFEILGPITTKIALQKAGEVNKKVIEDGGDDA